MILFLFKLVDCTSRVPSNAYTATYFEADTVHSLKVLVSQNGSNPQFLWVDVSTNKVIANRRLDHRFQLTAYTVILSHTIKSSAIAESTQRLNTSLNTDNAHWCQWLWPNEI